MNNSVLLILLTFLPLAGMTAILLLPKRSVGVVLGAAYMLWLLQRAFLGTLKNREWEPHLPDLDRREWAMLLPLAAIVVVLGVWPSPALSMMNGSVNALVQFLHNSATVTTTALNTLP